MGKKKIGAKTQVHKAAGHVPESVKQLIAEEKPYRKMGTWAWVGFLVLEIIFISGGVYVYYRDRILPGVKVGEVRVGSAKRDDAEKLLIAASERAAGEEIKVVVENKVWVSQISDLGVIYLPEETANKAWEMGRGELTDLGNLFGSESRVEWVYADQGIDDFIAKIALETDITSVEPSVDVVKNDIKIVQGTRGRELDKDKLRIQIKDLVALGKGGKIGAYIQDVDPTLTADELILNQARAERLATASMTLKLGHEEWKLDGETILTFMAFPVGFDEQKIGNWVASLAKTVNKEPQNALFNFAQGRVEAFQPGENGIELEEDKLNGMLVEGLNKIEEEKEQTVAVELPVRQTTPEIATGEVNDFGIKELVGVGKSTFRGSIANRVHNVDLAASRLHGMLIAPGETFSFNKTVGEISKATGFKEAYVIEKGRTVLGDGGGVCQVSSTLFRAILDAGLPVVERKAHAYRVSYYEQDSKPGMDATVFEPTVDLKFTNDTPGHILVQALLDKKNYALTIEFYGTSDGRIVNVTTPKVSNQTAPPPDLYQDDPTLPNGTVKQVDFKAWGAKVTFDYKVERNGETLIDKTFVSSYRPWQAVFLRGTGPAI